MASSSRTPHAEDDSIHTSSLQLELEQRPKFENYRWDIATSSVPKI
jgi:hypothetical protein